MTKRTIGGCVTEQRPLGQATKFTHRLAATFVLCLVVMAPVLATPVPIQPNRAPAPAFTEDLLAQANQSVSSDLGDASSNLATTPTVAGKSAGQAIIEALESPILRNTKIITKRFPTMVAFYGEKIHQFYYL